MILEDKTLVKLRNLINEETEHRKGPALVAFFNKLGFKDTYGQGFPSRWIYTDGKLAKINGTLEIDKCIKTVFDPRNFIGKIDVLDSLIEQFNEYLAFDGWKVVRNNKDISFAKVGNIDIPATSKTPTEDEFLSKQFEDIPIDKINLETQLLEIVKYRIEEIKKCFLADASLGVIFLTGSTLEGILLGVAQANPRKFNESNAAPKDKEGKVLQLPLWTLNQLINTSHELRYIGEDVKKFSHSLKDFRNYIHPYQQMISNFYPDKHTAQICFQVLKAVLFQLSKTTS